MFVVSSHLCWLVFDSKSLSAWGGRLIGAGGASGVKYLIQNHDRLRRVYGRDLL